MVGPPWDLHASVWRLGATAVVVLQEKRIIDPFLVYLQSSPKVLGRQLDIG